jgi:hypothetical protein
MLIKQKRKRKLSESKKPSKIVAYRVATFSPSVLAAYMEHQQRRKSDAVNIIAIGPIRSFAIEI